MEGTKLDKTVMADKAERELVMNWSQVFDRLLCVFVTGQKRPLEINSNLKLKQWSPASASQKPDCLHKPEY